MKEQLSDTNFFSFIEFFPLFFELKKFVLFYGSFTYQLTHSLIISFLSGLMASTSIKREQKKNLKLLNQKVFPLLD